MGWENSRQLCKPSTSSRVCITVSNSTNPSRVYIRLCKLKKKVFYCFYKINFPRENAKLFVWHRLNEKFLPVAKSCPRSLARITGADPGFFLGGGVLVSCSTSTPINHIVFLFLQNTSCIRKPQVTLPLDPPLRN